MDGLVGMHTEDPAYAHLRQLEPAILFTEVPKADVLRGDLPVLRGQAPGSYSQQACYLGY